MWIINTSGVINEYEISLVEGWEKSRNIVQGIKKGKQEESAE